MQPETGPPRQPDAEPLLPPATTQWRPLTEPADDATLPLPPFFTGASQADGTPRVERPRTSEQPTPPAFEAAMAGGIDEWQPEGTEAAIPLDAFLTPEEPIYGNDAEAVNASPGFEDTTHEEALVLLEDPPAGHELEHQLVQALASRLEDLANRLRRSGLAALTAGDGEPVDTVLAAVLGGYVAARTR